MSEPCLEDFLFYDFYHFLFIYFIFLLFFYVTYVLLQTLDLMTPKLSDEDCAVAKLPRNRQRNRFMDVLPRDKKMPYLVTPHPNDPESNYINAIFADVSSKRRYQPYRVR